MGTSFKFGEDFELDPEAYELRRAGRIVRLERIPMAILLLLIERRPSLVTREQIVEKIWGKGVFFDTDNSINGAIRKIRQALKDNSGEPRYILTVTGMGYRFIASLPGGATAPETATGLAPPAPKDATPPVPAAAPVPAATPVGAIAPPRAFRPGRWLFLLGALVLAGAVGVYLPWSRGTFERGRSEGRKMLAVLPFENLTGDPAEDYFSDGFTEEMISRLGNLEPDRLGVIARTSVMHYKQAHAPLDRLGRELGVEYVLEGSIRRDHERVRITAQLIQIEDQTHLWSRQYDRDRTDVLRVQSEIAQAIADQIEDTLGGSATRPALPTALSPRTYEGYDQYLRGLYHWNKRTPEDLRLAIESFQRAVAINPEDARSYAALASTHALMGSYSYVPQSEAFQTAREAALQAIELDSRLAAAHTSLALINEFADFDWRTAEERFRRAIALDANYPTAHHWYAEYLAHQGRFDEAASEIELARRLDPRSLIIAADRGAILYFARQFAPAIEQFRSVLAVEPGFGRAHMIIFAYAQQGHLTEALEQIQEWRKFEDGPWLGAGSAYLHGRLGRMAEAREALREMEESNRRWHQDILTMRATAYIGMGLENEALDCLQKLCEKRSAYLVFLKVDPLYDPLRDDPRFPDLLRCANLAL